MRANERVVVVAAVVFGTIGGIIPIALAQQAGTGSSPAFSTYDLFHGDLVEVDPGDLSRLVDTIRHAERPPDCPIGRLKMRVPQGTDPLFDSATLGARRDALLVALDRHFPVAGRLVVETSIFGTESGMDTVLEAGRDIARPVLRASSQPPKGTLVQAGDTIRLTILARDGDGRWETGIKAFRLVVDSEGRRVIAAQSYTPCTEPKERRLEATYRVPNNPPPIVRISAVTEDAAGNRTTGYLEFPTQGDWYGTITWFFHNKEEPTADHSGSEVQFDGLADFTLRYDGRGNLKGTLQGTWKIDKHLVTYPQRGEVCTGSVPTTPVSGDLVGSYTPGVETFTLHPTSVVAKAVVPQRGGGPHLQCTDSPLDYSSTLAALLRSRLQRGADGVYRANSNSSTPQFELHYSLRVQRVLPSAR